MKNLYKYVTRPIKDLIEYDKNPRKHSELQIEQLVNAIQEWGFTNPLLIDENNNVIAGHGRLKAAQLLNLKTVPCIVVTDLTDAQRRALIIADNKIAENSTWDEDLLKQELESLKMGNFDLCTLGFDSAELEKLCDEAFNGCDLNFDDLEISYGNDEHSTGIDNQYLKWGDQKVIISDEEILNLNKRHDQHIDIYGSNLGFVSALLRGAHVN